ncbi:MAG: plastocyanin/azurin family copper-binding protein [Nitrososphaera sp.]
MGPEGDTQSFTFEEAGEFDYYCTLHPNMIGKVIVTDEYLQMSNSFFRISPNVQSYRGLVCRPLSTRKTS